MLKIYFHFRKEKMLEYNIENKTTANFAVTHLTISGIQYSTQNTTKS